MNMISIIQACKGLQNAPEKDEAPFPAKLFPKKSKRLLDLPFRGRGLNELSA
jgi:hypothetical protein